MDNLFVRVSLVICWMNSLRSPRTLSRRCDQCQYRATMLPRHFHLPLFRRTKETEPQASLIAPPNARPNIWRPPLGTKLRTKPFLFIQTEHDPDSRPSPVHGRGLSLPTGTPTRLDSRLHELSASSYQLQRSLGLMNRPRFDSGYAAIASRDVPMGPFVGEEERESLGE